jgi:integrase/recombinase XerD
MNMTPIFNSSMAEAMDRFVEFKRLQGYAYNAPALRLLQFDQFLVAEGYTDTRLEPTVFGRFLVSTAHLKPATRQGLAAVVRAFSRHRHLFCPESAVMPERMLPVSSASFRFTRLEPADVCTLMGAVASQPSRCPARPHAMRFLIGLLYVTGLRVSEALNLNIGDVDLGQGTLLVRCGKFGKDRLVALSPSALNETRAWMALRASHAAPEGRTAPLLVCPWNRRLTYTGVAAALRVLRRQGGLAGLPTFCIHDLRHNYACHCLEHWQQTGADIEKLLPVLANAMGHVGYFATQKYLHVDARALQHAATKFQAHVVHKLQEAQP